jgi:histidyl-tRNA synthetase
MGKAMKQASTVGARFTVIVGRNELNEDSVTLRDMSTGDQKIVKIVDLVSLFN